MAMFFEMRARPWSEAASRTCWTAAPFLRRYECSDGDFSIGSIEPQFYALLREQADLTDPEFETQMDRKAWPALKEDLTLFKTRRARIGTP